MGKYKVECQNNLTDHSLAHSQFEASTTLPLTKLSGSLDVLLAFGLSPRNPLQFGAPHLQTVFSLPRQSRL